MFGGVNDSLLSRFRSEYPEFEGLEAVMDGTTLRIGERGQEPVLWIYEEDDSWAATAKEAHAHRQTPEEALDLIAEILKGAVRCATEHRGDTLAMTWFERWDGEAFEVADKSVFLSPYDADEWAPRSGDVWKQVRVSRVYVPETKTIAVSTNDSESLLSLFGIPETTNWFDDGLGIPAIGMKWTASRDYRFVFQAPSGWRRKPLEKDHWWLDFAQTEGPLILRTYNVYRDSKTPGPIKPYAREPDSITREHHEEPNWCSHRWTLLFTDGRNEMMGVLELFYPSGSPELAEPHRTLIDSNVGQSLYAPDDWDMRRP